MNWVWIIDIDRGNTERKSESSQVGRGKSDSGRPGMERTDSGGSLSGLSSGKGQLSSGCKPGRSVVSRGQGVSAGRAKETRKQLAVSLPEDMIMKKAALVMGIIFLILTFTGGGYVLINHGQVNAGYAVIPGLWTMICFGYYRK